MDKGTVGDASPAVKPIKAVGSGERVTEGEWKVGILTAAPKWLLQMAAGAQYVVFTRNGMTGDRPQVVAFTGPYPCPQSCRDAMAMAKAPEMLRMLSEIYVSGNVDMGRIGNLVASLAEPIEIGHALSLPTLGPQDI